MWSVCASSETGACRRVNEDRALADGAKGLIAVFDGAFAGGAAAEMGLQVTRALTDDDIAQGEPTLKRLADDIHAKVQSARLPTSCATTLLVATIREHTIHLAHVGDCRAYLFRAGQLTQLTTDHTLMQELVARGEISLDEADRAINRDVITRVLGFGDYTTPDMLEVEAQPGDIVLLCTDGVWKALGHDEMVSALQAGPFEECAARITQLSASPGRDNSSVAALHVSLSSS